MANATTRSLPAASSFDAGPAARTESGILDGRLTSFDVLLFEAGLRIGALHPDERPRLDRIVRDLLRGVHDLGETIVRLTDPDCTGGGQRLENTKPRIYLTCDWGRNHDLCTEIHLEGTRGSDFRYDPRRERKLYDQRPGYEAIHVKDVSCLSEAGHDGIGSELKASISEMVLSAHRRMLIRLEEHFEVELVSEPILVHLDDGETRLDVELSSVLAQRQAARATAAEVEKQQAILRAFEATFPETDPERFTETYRVGKRRGWTSKRIGEELAGIGAPANSTGTVSSGARTGTRRFEYTVADLSGAVKMIEAALAATAPGSDAACSRPASDPPRP